jgi:hypothetical protein
MAGLAVVDRSGIDLGEREIAQPENGPSGDIPVQHEFALSSRPGAPVTLFLDFNGHIQHENVGGADIPVIGGEIGGWSNFELPAYDTDDDPLTYSLQEQEDIHEIWSVVAEDYAPFDINVTTVDPDPGRLHPDLPYLRVIMSGGSDVRDGKDQGGFADIGGYKDENEPNVAFVFLKEKDTGLDRSVRFLADAASHEAGHSFGLDHYEGGTGDEGKAPIMEDDGAHPARRGTWWGDDMDQLVGHGNGFGYRADDHANGISGASSFVLTNTGPLGRGVIEKTTDVDTFRFVTGGGDLSITVKGASLGTRGSATNLDAVVRLLNASGGVIAESDDPITLFARVETSVPAGTYYVQVASHGEQGDVGQYTVSVSEEVGPRVVSSQFLPLSETTATLLVTFNEPIHALTFTTFDVSIHGRPAGADVLSVSPIGNEPTSFLVTYVKPTTPTGDYNIAVGPNIDDLFGNGMDQNQNGLSLEAVDHYFASYFNWDTIYNPPYKAPKPKIGTTFSPLSAARA